MNRAGAKQISAGNSIRAEIRHAAELMTAGSLGKSAEVVNLTFSGPKYNNTSVHIPVPYDPSLGQLELFVFMLSALPNIRHITLCRRHLGIGKPFSVEPLWNQSSAVTGELRKLINLVASVGPIRAWRAMGIRRRLKRAAEDLSYKGDRL